MKSSILTFVYDIKTNKKVATYSNNERVDVTSLGGGLFSGTDRSPVIVITHYLRRRVVGVFPSNRFYVVTKENV